jgi:hypothetical protein
MEELRKITKSLGQGNVPVGQKSNRGNQKKKNKKFIITYQNA